MSDILGKLIQKKRKQMGLSQTELSHESGVNLSFIQSLENSDYSGLPAEIYVKNILKRISKTLDLDSFILYKHFREEFKKKNRDKTKKKEENPIIETKRMSSIWYLTPNVIGIIISLLLVLIIIAYFFTQASKLFLAPELVIEEPSEDNLEVEESSIVIRGETTANAYLDINGQEVEIFSNGEFSQEINLVDGLNVIKIRASNRLDKKVEKSINIIYNSPGDESLDDGEYTVNPFEDIFLDSDINLKVKALSSIATLSIKIDDQEEYEKVLLRDAIEVISAKNTVEIKVQEDNLISFIYNEEELGEFPSEEEPEKLKIIFENEKEEEDIPTNEDETENEAEQQTDENIE